ncbi:uncharacterized protein EI90DRAFT_3043491, partial [Cantharellus anzutake]|uniref:uncharacterized protein n=1 Tax=Cantharellus anzutake TaxID=1750568 RepID=UPI001905684A
MDRRTENRMSDSITARLSMRQIVHVADGSSSSRACTHPPRARSLPRSTCQRCGAGGYMPFTCAPAQRAKSAAV